MIDPGHEQAPNFSLPNVTEQDVAAYGTRAHFEAGVYKEFADLESQQPALAGEVQEMVAALARDDHEEHHMTALAVAIMGLLGQANKRQNQGGATPLSREDS